MELIDKDAILAEIEKLVDKGKYHEEYDCAYRDGNNGALYALKGKVNSLEVKEVDLDFRRFAKEMDAIFALPSSETENTEENPLNWEYAIAKHFFGLGLKAKDWEKERMEECPYRQVGCTMYEGKILECRGACSWVVDYPKLKELKARKGEKV